MATKSSWPCVEIRNTLVVDKKSHLEVASIGVALHVSLAEDAGLAHRTSGHQLGVNVRVPARHDCLQTMKYCLGASDKQVECIAARGVLGKGGDIFRISPRWRVSISWVNRDVNFLLLHRSAAVDV